MFEDFEFNPISAVFGVVGGVVSLIVMSQVEVNFIFKILGFIGTIFVCYVLTSYQFSR